MALIDIYTTIIYYMVNNYKTCGHKTSKLPSADHVAHTALTFHIAGVSFFYMS